MRKESVADTSLHERQFGRAARVIFSAKVTMYGERIPKTENKLGQAPRWQRGLGKLPRRHCRPAGENAHELETLEPSAVSEPWPVIFNRLHFSILAVRKPVVAI